MAERTRLGEAIDKWLQRLRVTKAHVARYGGVSPNTLNYISQGTTASPEMATLRKVARGLATDPFGTHEVDRHVYAEAWRDLALACGFPDPTVEDAPPTMEASIRTVAKPSGSAESWAEFIRDHSEATPDQIRMLRALWEAMTARGIARLGERDATAEGSTP